MKQTYIILLITLIFAACNENEGYFYDSTPETIDMSMWDYLRSDTSNHTYFMELVAKHGLIETINSSNPVTLFIPSDEDLRALDTSDVYIKKMLSYIVLPAVINIQTLSKSNKVQTYLEKFALLEYNSGEAVYSFDGKKIVESSPLFVDGRFYVLEDVVWPAPNLYEYISSTNSVFRDYIDMQDSTYFDVAASKPIDFGSNGTIYDSVFTTVNTFFNAYFPVNEEYRYKTATFVLFTQEQLDSAFNIVKTDLNIDVIPNAWKNDILLPYVITRSIFDNSLQYSDFEPEMLNIKGEGIDVDVDNINENSRFVCSNGIVFNMTEFVVPEELYKAQKLINGSDALTEVLVGDKWIWNLDKVRVEGLDGTSIEPTLFDVSTGALNNKVLGVSLGNEFADTFRLTFVQKGVFGAEKYRLLWSGSSTYCGRFRIYINGEALQMRSAAGKDQDYFDSYEFSNSVVKSITGNGVYKKVGNFNLFDFEVFNITDYTDVEITFEYIGPSLDSRGKQRGQPGLVIDYFKLEIYE